MSNFILNKIKNIRLSDQVMEQIEGLILDGSYKPGERLPSQSQLGEALQVSQSSMREALRALETKGIIEVRAGAGIYVSEDPFSFQNATDAFEWLLKRKVTINQALHVREALEGLAASLFAANPTDDVIDALQNIVEQQRLVAQFEKCVEKLSDLDIQFHLLIARSSQNQLLEDLICSIVTQFFADNQAVLYLDGRIDISITGHQRIIEAFKSQDSMLAEALMRDHVSNLRKQILQSV